MSSYCRTERPWSGTIIKMKRQLLDRNEVLQGLSPKALQALRAFKKDHASTYIPGYYSSLLIPALSGKFRIPEDRIILSYGIEDFLSLMFEKVSERKGSILTSEYHYTYYRIHAKFKNVRLLTFRMPEAGDSFSFDIKDFIRKYRAHKPEMILLASPANPTGNVLSVRELEVILKNVKKDCPVLLDQAYRGFEKKYNERSFLRLLEKYPNLALLRTFSKYYALAGMRIGFALCGKKVKELLNYENRFLGLSRVLEETAIAALNSETYYRRVAAEVKRDREYLISKLRAKGLKVFSSNANFILLRPSPRAVSEMKRIVKRQKIVLVKFFDDGTVRISVGLRKYINALLKDFKSIEA